MAAVETVYHGNVAVVRLTNEPANAIGRELVADLSAALEEARHKAGAMVICGGPKFFSIGIDLPFLLTLESRDMAAFWDSFTSLCFDLYAVEIPVICALSGHAVAGGNILALSADFRFGCREKKRIGLNEIKLGVPVPGPADLILRQVVGDRVATRMMYEGNFLSFEEAEAVGLIDELHPADSVEERAVEKAAMLADFEPKAFSAIKNGRVDEVRSRHLETVREKNERFLDCWFSEPVRRKLAEAAKKF